MESFEEALAGDVMLAFFVPGVAYIADAVGTQTETLVIRGLSFGVPVRRMVRKEALTGLAVGAGLAAAAVADLRRRGSAGAGIVPPGASSPANPAIPSVR